MCVCCVQGWTGKSWNGEFTNSAVSFQPNWGVSGENYTYGAVEFINTSVLLNSTTDRADVVTLMPFSPSSGIANLKGDLHVYSSEICSCCNVNYFGANQANLAQLNLTCHGASSWPFLRWGG